MSCHEEVTLPVAFHGARVGEIKTIKVGLSCDRPAGLNPRDDVSRIIYYLEPMSVDLSY